MIFLQYTRACSPSARVSEASVCFFTTEEDALLAVRAVVVELHRWQLRWEGGKKELEVGFRLDWGEEQLEAVREKGGRVDIQNANHKFSLTLPLPLLLSLHT